MTGVQTCALPIYPADNTADTLALRHINRKIQADTRVDMCLLPVGDGVTLARRR